MYPVHIMYRPLPNEILDEIIELLPVHVAIELRRKAVLRRHIMNGKLRRPLQRALDRLDVPALTFFAGVCPKWKSTCPRWACWAAEDVGLTGSEEEEEEDISYGGGGGELVPMAIPGLGHGHYTGHHAGQGVHGGVGFGAEVDEDDEEEDDHDEDDDEEDFERGMGEDDEDAIYQWSEPVSVAIVRGRWDAVRFLIDAGFPTYRAVDIAVENGADFDKIRWLLSLDHKNIVTQKVMTRAACANMLPLVRYLHEKGFPMADESAIIKACTSNFPQMLAYLLDIGAPLPSAPVLVSSRSGTGRRYLRIGDLAASEGHLFVVE
ncbi:hypothetical protein BDK51DRAFT_37295, partial [Blyttiomyces helicus]